MAHVQRIRLKPSTPTAAAACIAAVTALVPLAAQESLNEEPILLNPLVITPEEAPADPANPLYNEIGGVFGPNRSLIDTPRTVGVATRRMLEDRNVDSFDELVTFAPGAYVPANYGSRATPNIRADVAEAYYNGQRRNANYFGVNVSFNGIERVELVNGPAPALLGPGFFTGGYVNYITKTASLDEPFTRFSGLLGTWVPDGDSYLKARWQVDRNQPITEDLAIRISYEGQENDTFFADSGGRDDFQDIFIAATWQPSETFRLEANAEHTWQAQPQQLGVNRPWQGLIDNGAYIVDPANPANTTQVGRTDTILAEGDFSNANATRLQTIATFGLEGGDQVINRTFIEHIDRRRLHQFAYYEWVDQMAIENRTELLRSTDWFNRQNEIVTGIAIRFEDRENYLNYNDYYPNAFDITDKPDTFALPFASSGREGPCGRFFYGPQDGFPIPETTDSQLWDFGAFWQHEIALSEQWSLLYGLRGDVYAASAENPLPPAGVAPWEDEQTFTSGGWHASLTWKPSDRASIYFSYNLSSAVNTASGGGLLLTNGVIEEDNFNTESELFEVGARLSLLDDALYLGATAYSQKRSKTELGGSPSDIIVQGVELQALYEPSENFYLNANLSWTDARFDDALPGFALDLNTAGQVGGFGPYGAPVAPAADPALLDAFGFLAVPGDYDISGVSEWLLNGGLGYQPDRGLGVSLWGSVATEQQGNVFNQYTIPTQFTLNGSLTWRADQWEASVAVLNLTDERNWRHNGDEFGNAYFIFQELPRRVEMQVRWGF